MKAKLKQAAEQLAAYRFWIERSADPEAVKELIRSLRPRGTVAPLVRVGPDTDGGYLLPDDFVGVSACISPGVSFEAGFDQAIAERGIDVYMADASVDGPPHANDRFHFFKKFIDLHDDATNMRLDTLCGILPASADTDLILQMDIEGAEWRVLLDADSGTLARFRIIAIEFHDMQQMFGRFSFGLIRATFGKLLRTHSVVHIHPNNVSDPSLFNGIAIPPVMEMTFYRNDRQFSDQPVLSYPHPLDVDNVLSRRHVTLPKEWIE